eukprot:g2037.t1
MIIDPGPHHHMPHPFARTQEQGYHSNNSGVGNSSTSTSSRRGGDLAHAATPHHFQGPPPPGWIESHAASSRGQEQRSTQPAPNPLRRSPRGNPATFRFDNSYPPPTHHSVHVRHLSGGGGGGPPPPGHHGGGGGLPSHHHQQQQRALPSPRGGPVGAGRGPPPMRPLPPNGSGGGGPRRRPEHLMVGPLGDPMFVGSPGTYGSMGLGGAEANLGMETVSRVLIPNCKIGAVIGKGGAIIKHIREVSGAKVTISDSCTGLHDDSDDRMVTAAGTFNSVQLAFTHILSHAGAVGPDADPVMGLAGGDPDCVANSFRLLIPNVKAGGLIGRGGCTIKAIREQSGARIEISSHAFHFHPVHGPLPASAHNNPPASQGAGQQPSMHSGPGDGGPRGGGGGGGGPGGASGGPPVNIPLPPPILMDRVMTAMGSFDACLRAHHLVASKLMDVRPSPVPMPSAPPPSSHGPPSHSQSAPMMIPNSSGSGSASASSSSSAAAAASAAAFAAAARGNGHGHGHGHGIGGCGPAQGMMQRGGPHPHSQHTQPHPHYSMLAFNHHDEPSRTGGGGGGGAAAARALAAGKVATASTSPASSVSEQSGSYHRQPWEFEDQRSWAAAAASSSSPPLPHVGAAPPMPPTAAAALCGELLSRESSSGRGSGTSTPRLSSSVAASRGSPRGSAGSVEDFNSSMTGMSDMHMAGSVVDRPVLSRARSSSSSGIGGGGAAVAALDSGGGGVLHQGGVLGGDNSGADNQTELPACLVGILDSFFGGGTGSENNNDGNANGNGSNSGSTSNDDDSNNAAAAAAAAARSPSTITGIEVSVGRSAFAQLGVHGLDDIKHLSGAGIIAPESVDAVHSSAARGNAPADGFSLAASAASAAAAATSFASSIPKRASSSSSSSSSSPSVRGDTAGGVSSGSSSSSLSSPSISEGFGKKGGGAGGIGAATTPSAIAAAAEGISMLGLGSKVGVNAGSVPSSLAAAAAAAAARSAGSGGLAMGGVGGVGGGGGAVGPNPLKTVRITGTAEEVQLAEYLIRVRTGRNIAAA